MGKVTGFKEYDRQVYGARPVPERVGNYSEFVLPLAEDQLRQQGARCMNCGIPFCHDGCPLGNLIPDWNHQVYEGRWDEALEQLHATNNFPEFTGRICPAPCEASCVLNIDQSPVTIKQLEVSIIDRAFEEGWIEAQPPAVRTGKTVAVIGSGPAGLAAAQQLNRAGHQVTLFERDDRIGGLLMYGIPGFKMEKTVVQRRVDLLQEEGIELRPNTNVGVDISVADLKAEYDAICICVGSTVPRDLPVPGRELSGVHFAMEFLVPQNKRDWGDTLSPEQDLNATGKNVVIIGGGDTGSDCLGTSIRQGANKIYQLELMPQPPEQPTDDNPWPQWPRVERISTSQQEGGERLFAVLTKSFSGNDAGQVTHLNGVKVEWSTGEDGRPGFTEIPGSEFTLEADLVLFAMGYLHPDTAPFVKDLGVELDARGNLMTNGKGATSVPGVYAAGDAARGQSLVVWAIAEGRNAAREIDLYLMGETVLP